MFTKNNSTYRVIEDTSGLAETLPPALYKVQFSKLTGFSLQQVRDKFLLPKEILNTKTLNDNSEGYEELFLTRFKPSTKNLGILLAGTKGTGKSLLLKQTSNKAIVEGFPVLMVEEAFNSAALADFISSIDQRVVVVFDEFEKRYELNGDEYNSQADLLSLFDGTSATSNMFILTVNNLYKVDQFFLNRPSRIRYLIEFTGLTEEFISSYLSKYLLNNNLTQQVKAKLSTIDEVNFDLLETAVDEVNLSPSTRSVDRIFKDLNITYTKDMYTQYLVNITLNGKFIRTEYYTLDFDDLSINRVHIHLTKELTPTNNFKLNPEKMLSVRGRDELSYTDTIEDNTGNPVTVELYFTRVKPVQLEY